MYDATYDRDAFELEMSKAGFTVHTMVPAIGRFGLQSWISHKLDDVIPLVSSSLVDVLERFPSDRPLEWVAVCSAD